MRLLQELLPRIITCLPGPGKHAVQIWRVHALSAMIAALEHGIRQVCPDVCNWVMDQGNVAVPFLPLCGIASHGCPPDEGG